MPKRVSTARIGTKVLAISIILTALMLTECDCNGVTNGDGGDEEISSLVVFNPATNSWSDLTRMPTPRSTAAAGVINGKLYVVGGKDSKAGRGAMNILEIYDPATDTWTTGANMPTKRWGPAAEVIDGKLFVVGGALNLDNLYTVLEIYDPATDSWSTGPSMNTARYRPAVGVIDGKLLVAGGQGVGGDDIPALEIYDPALNAWLPQYDMPVARGQSAAGVINGVLYVAGGFRWVSGTKTQLDRVDAYQPGLVWITGLEPMPSARGEAVAGVINGKLYVVAGLFEQGESQTVLGSMVIYDPVADSWTTGPALSLLRSEATGGVINGKFYVVGGYDLGQNDN